MQGIERLVEACGTGEILDVIYFAGNQPGTRREITVIAVGNGLLKARCQATGLPKTFRLELVALWDGDPTVPLYDAGKGRAAAKEKTRKSKLKVQARSASDRMILGMSGIDVRRPVTGHQQASARLIEGMSSVGTLKLDGPELVANDRSPAAETVTEPTAPATLWQSVRRMFGWS